MMGWNSSECEWGEGEPAGNRDGIETFSLTNYSIPSFSLFHTQFVDQNSKFEIYISKESHTAESQLLWGGESCLSLFPYVPIEHRLDVWVFSVPFCSVEPYCGHLLFHGAQTIVKGISGKGNKIKCLLQIVGVWGLWWLSLRGRNWVGMDLRTTIARNLHLGAIWLI